MIRKKINNTKVVNIITMILFVVVIIVNLGFSFAWFTASKSATVEDPTLKFGTIQIETNNDTYFNNASSTYYNSIQSGSNLLSNDIKLNLKSGSEKCYVRARMDFTATNPTSEDEKILKYLKYKDYTLASSSDYKWSSKIGDYWYLLNAFGMPLEVTNTTTGYYTFLTKEQTKLDMTFDASLVSANGIKMKVTLEAIQVDNINSIGLPSTLENIESALNDVNNINTPTDNFSVTFVDLDGSTTTVNANYKGSLTVPTSMQAYIQAGFALWDGGESIISGTSNSHSYIEDVILYNITENLTLYANSKNFAFTVNYYNGSNLLQSNSNKYNSVAEYFGSTPVKESTAQYKYNFIGWSETNSDGAQIVTDFTVKSSKNYYAQYEAETRKYLVTFRNHDGEILQQTEIPYNTTPSYIGKTPTKNSDSNYSYTFKGWSPTLSAVTSDQNYVATYNQTALPTQKYLVKWKNYDGSVLKTEELEYGATPSYTGSTPTRMQDVQYTYTFKGWSPEISVVTSEQNYVAQYSSQLRSYTINFVNYDDSQLVSPLTLTYGSAINYNGATPTKPADENNVYVFAGWSLNEVLIDLSTQTVTGNATYKAVFNTLVPLTLPSTWETDINWTNLGLTEVTDLTSIRFEKTAPSGYAKTSENINNIEIWQNSTTKTKIAFVYASKIMAPASCNQLFYSLTNITELLFNNFNTSFVTDMSYMFVACVGLTNLDLSGFDTSNVTTMTYMFTSCTNLNSLDLNNFNTDNVTDMSAMFTSCSMLNSLNVCSFNTQSVTNMSNMFWGCSSLTSLDVSSFDTRNVRDMNYMFYNCSGLTSLDLSSFDTRLVTDMSKMFYGCSGLTSLDLSNFDTSKVTDMNGMFSNCSELLHLDISNFITNNVINMSAMFSDCSNLTSIYVSSNFVTTSVTNSTNMFNSCSNLVGGNGTVYNSSNITASYARIDTEGTPGYFTEKRGLFSNTWAIKLNWTNLGLNSEKDLTSIIFDFVAPKGYLKTSEKINDIEIWQDATIQSKIAFVYSEIIKAPGGKSRTNSFPEAITSDDEFFFNYANGRPVNPESCSYLFSHLENIQEIIFNNFDTSSIKNMGHMFFNCPQLKILDLTCFETFKATYMYGMFAECRKLTTIYSSYNFSTENLTSTGGRFTFSGSTSMVGGNGTTYYTDYATYARIDNPPEKPGYFTEKGVNFTSTWKTDINWANLGLSAVTDLTSIRFEKNVPFNYELTTEKLGDIKIAKSSSDSTKIAFVCEVTIYAPESCHSLFRELTNLKNIVFNNFNTSKVTNMGFMFTGSGLTGELDLKIFNTINVTAMTYMFHSCSGLTTLDLSNFNTSKVTDTQGMFYNCSSLTSINLTSFDTSSVTNMNRMFYSCSSLTSLDVSNFDTSKVTNMGVMFLYCTELTSLNLTSFDTSSVTDMSDMFYGCIKLGVIYVGDRFVTTKVTVSDNMFYNCTKLVGGNGTTYNSSYVDKTYARLDKAGTPGYFTRLPLTTFVDFSFQGLPINFHASYIWTDGSDYYYSFDSAQYILNKSTSTWEKKTWRGFTNFYGSYVWTDGSNYYYSFDSAQYILNKSTSTWKKKTWNGYTKVSGSSVWTDGSNIYYSSYSDQYILNKSTSTWSKKTWNGLTSFSGDDVWTDGSNIFYSSYSDQYILNKSASTWYERTWNGLTSFHRGAIWTDGSNYYCSYFTDDFVLNKSTLTWEPKTWSGLTGVYGGSIWTDGSNYYYSSETDQYILNKSTSTWSKKTWNRLTSFDSRYVWTDGSNIYYSNYDEQYMLNKSTLTWSKKTWGGLPYFWCNPIWTDGSDYYYSKDSTHYILNKSTSTWEEKTWSGLTSFYGDYVWTDGSNYYYSSGTYQYILNKSTSTWETKIWSGLTSFDGKYVWTDGSNIYYADDYVLNKSTSIWEEKTWSDLTSFNASYIWTDGNNVYYSSGTNQYILNKETSTWEVKTWSGLTNFDGEYVWTDGSNYYYRDEYKII